MRTDTYSCKFRTNNRRPNNTPNLWSKVRIRSSSTSFECICPLHCIRKAALGKSHSYPRNRRSRRSFQRSSAGTRTGCHCKPDLRHTSHSYPRTRCSRRSCPGSWACSIGRPYRPGPERSTHHCRPGPSCSRSPWTLRNRASRTSRSFRRNRRGHSSWSHNWEYSSSWRRFRRNHRSRRRSVPGT